MPAEHPKGYTCVELCVDAILTVAHFFIQLLHDHTYITDEIVMEECIYSLCTRTLHMDTVSTLR